MEGINSPTGSETKNSEDSRTLSLSRWKMKLKLAEMELKILEIQCADRERARQWEERKWAHEANIRAAGHNAEQGIPVPNVRDGNCKTFRVPPLTVNADPEISTIFKKGGLEAELGIAELKEKIGIATIDVIEGEKVRAVEREKWKHQENFAIKPTSHSQNMNRGCGMIDELKMENAGVKKRGSVGEDSNIRSSNTVLINDPERKIKNLKNKESAKTVAQDITMLMEGEPGQSIVFTESMLAEEKDTLTLAELDECEIKNAKKGGHTETEDDPRQSNRGHGNVMEYGFKRDLGEGDIILSVEGNVSDDQLILVGIKKERSMIRKFKVEADNAEWIVVNSVQRNGNGESINLGTFECLCENEITRQVRWDFRTCQEYCAVQPERRISGHDTVNNNGYATFAIKCEWAELNSILNNWKYRKKKMLHIKG